MKTTRRQTRRIVVRNARRSSLAVLAGLTLLLAAPAGAATAPLKGANTLGNGGFEQPQIAARGRVLFGPGSTLGTCGAALPSGVARGCWQANVYGQGVESVENGYWQAAEGRQSVYLGNYGFIRQGATVLPNQTYRVTFRHAASPDFAGTAILEPAVYLSNSQGAQTTVVRPGSYFFDSTGRTRSNLGWVTHSFEFRTGPTDIGASLRFQGSPFNGPASFGPTLDGVALTRVS